MNKVPELHEQVFFEERTAQVQELEQKTDIVKDAATKLLQQKVKRKREHKATAQQRKSKKKKDAFTSKNCVAGSLAE